MTTTYYGIDQEFAVATGDNVGTTETTSTFDNPPQWSKHLVISSHAGDDDPNLFEIGDSYDVSWGGQGGGGTILNAIVVRSDPAPDGNGAGVIVLEGVDGNGNPAQVIWTPGFDLERWYGSNYNPSMEPQFYTEDTNRSYNHTYVCFAAGTLIDTAHGPIPVENLRANDRIMTLDQGPQPVIWIGRRDCVGFRSDAPVTFGAGSIGNERPLIVSQQHRILIRSTQLELHYGNSDMLMSAKSFIGMQNVSKTPCATVRYYQVLLRDHHLIWANGALCESLYLSNSSTALCAEDPSFLRALKQAGLQHCSHHTARPVLRVQDAARFFSMYPWRPVDGRVSEAPVARRSA